MIGSGLGFLLLCLALGEVEGLWRPGTPLLWTLRRFSLASTSLMFISLLLMWLSLLITVDRSVLVLVLRRVWGFQSGFVGHILAIMLTFASGLSLLVVLVRLGQGMGVLPKVVR